MAPTAASAPSSGGANPARRHSKKKQKRQRGSQKFRILNLVRTGETSQDKYLKGGRIRKLDVLRKTDEDALPRKTREMLSSMAKVRGDAPMAIDSTTHSKDSNPGDNKNLGHHNKQQSQQKKESDGNSGDGAGQTDVEIHSKKEKKESSRERSISGMQPGESYPQFAIRLQKERRQLQLETGRKFSHQRLKKKAHYEKRSLGKARRKRRRQGEISSSDEEETEKGEGEGEEGKKKVEDEWDEREGELSRLPMYWQEIVKNQGRPISEKKRRRMDRMEKAAEKKLQERVKFGEQAERPPTFTALPRKRGKSGPV